MPSRTPSAEWLDQRVRSLPQSPTLAMNELGRGLAGRGQEVYRLGFGQSPFPVPEPVLEALRRHAPAKDYLPVRGLGELREAVAGHVERHLGLRRDPEHVLIGPGSKTLLFLIQLALDAEVLLPAPSWVSYAPQAALAGRSVVWLPTRREDRWHLDPEVLREYCQRAAARPRILILNYPNNPNGATMPVATLKGIAAVARDSGLLVVADEIYGLVEHAGPPRSVASHYPEGTIITNGLSKWCGAGGWRLGTLIAPRELEWLVKALSALAGEIYSCASAPVQHAAATAYRGGPEIDAYLHQVRRILGALGRHVAARLLEAGFALDPPDGGFYVFPDAGPHAEELRARGVTTSAEYCDLLLAESGVAVLPGAVFGRPPEELTFRLSYVDFDGRAALEAAGRLPEDAAIDAEFLRISCGRVLEGVDRLAQWTAAPAPSSG